MLKHCLAYTSDIDTYSSIRSMFFFKIFLLNCFLLSSSPLFVPNRATTGVHAPAACLRQHDHVGAQRLVQRHDV